MLAVSAEVLIVTVRSKTSVPLIVAERQTDNTNCWMAAPPLFDVDTDTAKFLVLGEEMEVTVGVAGAVAIGAGPNVNVTGELDATRKPILAALVAVTEQLAAADALRLVVFVIEHPAPVTEKLSAPVPEPPEAVRVIEVPAVPLNAELVIVSGACATGVGTTKEKVTGVLVALKNPVLAALFAVTKQLAAADALRLVTFVIEHPAPVTEKVSAPDPDPPVAVRVIGVPTFASKTELLIVNGACATGVGTNAAVSVASNIVVEPVPAEVTFAGVAPATSEVRI